MPLMTPFGTISILIDDNPVDYTANVCSISERLFPRVLARYQIAIKFKPDGKGHTLACVFDPKRQYRCESEDGDRLECQGFYSNDGYKMSIGIECETWAYVNGKKFVYGHDYDYDAEYLANGMAYKIMPDTNTRNYVFGIAWIDGVYRTDASEEQLSRDVETWYAADPTCPE